MLRCSVGVLVDVLVIPAKAGIQGPQFVIPPEGGHPWTLTLVIPAFAGMTGKKSPAEAGLFTFEELKRGDQQQP